MKNTKKIQLVKNMLFALCIAVMLQTVLGCRNELAVARPEDYTSAPEDDNTTPYNFPLIFEGFWNGLNRNYMFWDVDGPGYLDDVWDEYEPKFAALGVFPATQVGSPAWKTACETAYGYVNAIVDPLSDGHFSVAFAPETGLASTNKLTRLTLRPGFDPRDTLFFYSNWTSSSPADTNYNFMDGVISTYFKPGSYKRSSAMVELTPGLPYAIATGHIDIADTEDADDYILYVYFYRIFSCLLNEVPADPANEALTTSKETLNQFLTDLKDTNMKGVIVDMRGNMGGDPRDMSFLWGRFIEQPLTVALQRGKIGSGRLDYGPWMPWDINPAPENERIVNKTAPVVALVAKLTFSGAEFSTMAIRSLPSGWVVGEATGGATAVPRVLGEYNSGSFSSGPFITSVVEAGLECTTPDGQNFEGKGIPPDEPVAADWDAFFTGKDVQLEASINHIAGTLK